MWLVALSAALLGLASAEHLPHCFTAGVDFEVLSISAEQKAKIRVRWPGEEGSGWEHVSVIRYGPLLSDGYPPALDPAARSLTLKSSVQSVVLIGVEMGREYGVQICRIYDQAGGEPDWRKVPLRPITVHAPRNILHCAPRLRIDASLTPHSQHFNATVHWEPSELEHSEHWLRWGEVSDVGGSLKLLRPHLSHLVQPASHTTIPQLLPSRLYGVQVCSYPAGHVPLHFLWLNQKIFLMDAELELVRPHEELTMSPEMPGLALESHEEKMEEEVEKVLEAIEEEEREGLWLLTVLGFLAGIFMVSVAAAMLCHRMEPRPDPKAHDHQAETFSCAKPQPPSLRHISAQQQQE